MKKVLVPLFLAFLVCFAREASAQTTEFTFQGSLQSSGSPANGNHDLEFKMFDLASGGAQQGSTIQRLNVPVANGIFTVTLDFGAGVLPGSNRFLEIGIRVSGNTGGFQQLLPRQPVASAPYSVRSLNASSADTATNASQLGGVAASQYVLTTDPRMSDPRNPSPGSGSYIQNRTTTQALSNFSISGNGNADIFDAATQFNIGGFRVFSAPGTGLSNTFAGYRSGNLNLTGTQNTSVGYLSGESLTAGSGNSLFGMGTGPFLTTGGSNTFTGRQAGYSTTTGIGNTFSGSAAGYFNVSGGANAYFGNNAGQNTTASNNSFFGAYAGENTSTGIANTFIGGGSGIGNLVGSYNTALGISSGFTANNLSYATVIGAEAFASSSNSITLGRANGADEVKIPGNLTVGGIVNANLPSNSSFYIQNQSATLQTGGFRISGDGEVQGRLEASEFISGGWPALRYDNSNRNTTVGYAGTPVVPIGSDNVFVGAYSGASETDSGNTYVGADRGFVNGNHNSLFGYKSYAQSPRTRATAIGAFSYANCDFCLILGAVAGQGFSLVNTDVGIGTVTPASRLHVVGNTRVDGNLTTSGNGSFSGLTATANIGIGTATPAAELHVIGNGIVTGNVGIGTGLPTAKLHVAGNGIFSGNMTAAGNVFGAGLYVSSLGTDGTVAICLNTSSERLSTCSSSLRYKTNVANFSAGLDLIKQLRPINFDWKKDGNHDVGFAAEEVAEIDPRFVVYNQNGQVEGVKYDRLSVAFVNAFKEQQRQIEAQQKQIDEQKKQKDELQKQVDALKELVCSIKADAEICRTIER